MIRVIDTSHVDHGLTQAHFDFLQARFGSRTAFFAETVILPKGLPDLECLLYGPLVGDAPIRLEDGVYYWRRVGRQWVSRVISRPARPTRLLTVIAGPHGERAEMTLYTAFGGPLAPQEPGDPSCKDVRASSAFWAEHALAHGVY